MHGKEMPIVLFYMGPRLIRTMTVKTMNDWKMFQQSDIEHFWPFYLNTVQDRKNSYYLLDITSWSIWSTVCRFHKEAICW